MPRLTNGPALGIGMDLEGSHESVWVATAPGVEYPRLAEDVRVDVAVVGGGIVGITTAYLLKARGRSVAVLEADRILRGVTGHTTAKLTSQHGPRYHGLVKRFGLERARLHGEANQAALEWVRERVDDLGVDASLERAPAYVYSTHRREVGMLREEARVARDLGLPASFVTETDLPFSVEGAVRFDDQAHFHPRAFLLSLAEVFTEGGGLIFERTRATSVRDGAPCSVETEGGTVTADDVVVATNVPVNDRRYFVTRMKPVRSYGVAFQSRHPLSGMYINAGEPVRSVRRFDGPDGPMLVFVGDNHPVGHGEHTEQHHRNLIQFARDHFDVDGVAYHWSTQDYYPSDGLPYVGRSSPGGGRVWTATGFQGWGMTMGTVAALLFADLLAGEQNALADLYDPFSAGRVARDLVRPSLLAQQGHVGRMFIAQRLRDHPARELGRGDGAVVEVDGKRVAVHRDREGVLHARGAECMHMGCVVAWNHAEQSWDCPCHGSRFAGTGGVLHGPATRPLPERDAP